MRELSLREGDIVKIYSKIGGDQGWWKGEANGRVIKQANALKLSFKYYNISNINLHYFPVFFQIGWFPSTYVDEEGVQWNSGVKDHPIKSTALGEDSLSSFSLETHFTMNISTFVSFRHVRICFFSLSRNICVISVKKTAPSLFVLSGGRRKLNGAELALKWPRTSMALSLDRNTCKVR